MDWTAMGYMVGAMVWLGLGGWSFGKFLQLEEPPPKEAMGALLGFSVLLAPFAAGLAVVMSANAKASP